MRTSLAQIASTVTSEEKERIKKLMLQFLVRHYYFGKVWQALNGDVKENILDVLSDGKGMIPSEKVIDMTSLDIKPEKDFFDASGFYSYLKDKCIRKSDYQTAKYLWINLKMRNIKDMNDLYNVRDVILLLEITENRFAQMYQKNYFNPRKCNSAVL